MSHRFDERRRREMLYIEMAFTDAWIDTSKLATLDSLSMKSKSRCPMICLYIVASLIRNGLLFISAWGLCIARSYREGNCETLKCGMSECLTPTLFHIYPTLIIIQ